MEQLVRAFLLEELHGWNHETALVSCLKQRPTLCRQLGFETVPDQSTLWRTWHRRFSTDLRETIQERARTILIRAERVGVDVPRSPQRKARHPDADDGYPSSKQAKLSKADDVTDELQRTAYPALSLNRDDSSEIHPNSFWDLQAYLGLGENLAANEGARSFTLESSRDQTPLGHTHRSHLRNLSVDEIREMYREAVSRLSIELRRQKNSIGPVSLLSTRPRMIRLLEIGRATKTRSSDEGNRTSTPISGRPSSSWETLSRWFSTPDRFGRETVG